MKVVISMNWSKATNKELKVIAYQTPEAPTSYIAGARNELFKRGRKRSGKLTMRGKELIFKR